MDASTIDVLATLDPDSPYPNISTTTGMLAQDRQWSPFHSAACDRFLAKYIKTDFGWYIATQFANHRKPFPMMLMFRDHWVNKAYLMRSDPWKYFDRTILEAYHLATFVANKPHLGKHLKALLLSFGQVEDEDGQVHDIPPERHIARVAKLTKVPYRVVEAFEALFYNVVDRREDALYLAHEVYPDTRMVEFDEDYLKNSEHADLIKRVAYNHKDMDLTAYLTGIGDHTYLRKLAASDNREADLTKFLMGNGLLLSHTNLLNQRSVGMSRVSHLLAASRQGGQVQDEPTIGGIASLFSKAYAEATDQSEEVAMRQMKLDSGVTIEVNGATS